MPLARECLRLKRKTNSSILLSSRQKALLAGGVLCGGRWRHTDREVVRRGDRAGMEFAGSRSTWPARRHLARRSAIEPGHELSVHGPCCLEVLVEIVQLALEGCDPWTQ